VETEFLTPRKAAKFLQISLSTLNRYLKESDIPSYKVKGRRLFDKVELVAWVKGHSASVGNRGGGDAND